MKLIRTIEYIIIFSIFIFLVGSCSTNHFEAGKQEFADGEFYNALEEFSQVPTEENVAHKQAQNYIVRCKIRLAEKKVKEAKTVSDVIATMGEVEGIFTPDLHPDVFAEGAAFFLNILKKTTSEKIFLQAIYPASSLLELSRSSDSINNAIVSIYAKQKKLQTSDTVKKTVLKELIHLKKLAIKYRN